MAWQVEGAEPTVAERRSLASRLGGKPVIERIVGGLYDRLEADRSLRRLFGSQRADERRRLTEFFDELFGGSTDYSDRGLADVGMQRRHEHRVIEADESQRWLAHFEASMTAVGVDERVVADVLAVLRGPAQRLVNGGAPIKQVRAALVAAGKGDLAAVQAAIADQPALIGQRGGDGLTMLWVAAVKGRSEVVRWLLAQGAPLEARSSNEHATSVLISPYCAALAAGRSAVADALAGAGATLDLFDLSYLGRTPEVAALIHADPDAVRATCVEEDFYPMTALHYAVDGVHLDTVQLLVECGAEVEPYSRRLLATAARRESLPIVELLIAAGADARLGEHLGPIDTDRSIARRLIAHGLDLDRPPRGRESFLTMACRGDKGKRIEVVRALLALGADPTTPDGFGRTPIEAAERSGFTAALVLLTST